MGYNHLTSSATFRLLHVMAGAEHGGAERFFTRLIVALHRRGVAQQVVMRPFTNHCTVLAQDNVVVHPAPFRRLFDFTSGKVISTVTQDFQPTVVMTWMSRASAMTPKSKAIHVARLGGYYDLKYYQQADYLVGNTQHIVDYFHGQGWSTDRTCYLPNFPDIPQTTSILSRHHFNTPDGMPLLLSLGRFHDDKAFDILILALQNIPNAHLWLGGKGEGESALRKQAEYCGVSDRIRFIGWYEDVSALYNACDIYVCPSRVEPLGNVILEAWAHRKPVIAADSSGPKVLITSMHDGLLVPMNDSQRLAQAIQTVIDDKPLRQRLADNGYDTYQRYFTEEAVVHAYLTFFNHIVQRQQGTL